MNSRCSSTGRHYSIRKYPVSQGMVPSWNQEAFAVLSNLFQMTVTDSHEVSDPSPCDCEIGGNNSAWTQPLVYSSSTVHTDLRIGE